MCLWSVPTIRRFPSFQSRARREKGNRENVCPQKQKEVKERERGVTVARCWPSSVPPKSPKIPHLHTHTPHHSRTLHLHHSIKHIKKYTVLSRSKIVCVCESVRFTLVCAWVVATVKLCGLWTGEVWSPWWHKLSDTVSGINVVLFKMDRVQTPATQVVLRVTLLFN